MGIYVDGSAVGTGVEEVFSEGASVGLVVGDVVGIYVDGSAVGVGATGVEEVFSEGASVGLVEGDVVGIYVDGSAVGVGATGVEEGISEDAAARLEEGSSGVGALTEFLTSVGFRVLVATAGTAVGLTGCWAIGGIVGAKDVGIPDGATVSSTRFKSLLDIFRALWILFDAPGVNDSSLTAPSAFIPLLTKKVLEISSMSCTEGDASP